MAINRAPWTALVDDDGSNLVGTIWNKDKIKTVLLDPTDAEFATLGAWTAYTPVFSGPAPAPALGNGVIAGRYIKIGKWIDVAITFKYGSTTTPGSGGYWTFSLPLPPVLSTVAVGQEVSFLVGTISAGGTIYGGTVGYHVSNTVYMGTGTGALVGPAVPFTWTAGAVLNIRGSYEVA